MNGRVEYDEKLERQAKELLKDMPKFVTEWYEKMKASSKSATTRKDYLYKLRSYLWSVNKRLPIITPEDLTFESVVNYMNTIKIKINAKGEKEGTSGSHQRAIWSALNNFFSFMQKRKYISYNPMEEIDMSRKSDAARIQRKRKYLTKNDFLKIIEAVDTQKDSIRKTRDKAILLTFMCTGIREGALCQINLSDINFSTNMLTVIDKEELERDCYLTDSCVKAIKEWIEIRGNLVKKGHNIIDKEALFISQKNTRMSTICVYNLVKKYSELGLGYSISPHKLRAGFCTILYQETKDIRYVQEVVGHSNVTTTQKYTVIDRDSKKSIKNVFGAIGV